MELRIGTPSPIIPVCRSPPLLLPSFFSLPLLRGRPSFPIPFASGAITASNLGIYASFYTFRSSSLPLLPLLTITNPPSPTPAPTGPLTDAAAIAEAEKRASKKEE